MSAKVNPCPCGLIRAELDAHPTYLNGQICEAKFTNSDNTAGTCNRFYADHPFARTSSTSGTNNNYIYLNIY